MLLFIKFFMLFCEVPNYSFGLSVRLSVKNFFVFFSFLKQHLKLPKRFYLNRNLSYNVRSHFYFHFILFVKNKFFYLIWLSYGP